MKVEGIHGPKQFSELELGATFLWCGILYIKIDKTTTVTLCKKQESRLDCNAFDPANAVLTMLNDDQDVVSINAKVVIG